MSGKRGSHETAPDGSGGGRMAIGVMGALALAWGAILIDLPPIREALGGIEKSPDAVRVALLAVGSLFLYLAWSGQRLTTFKAGGVEATLANVVDEVVNDPDVPDDVKVQVSRLVTSGSAPLEARRDARAVLSARDEAIAYEDRVLDALRSLAEERPHWHVDPNRRSNGPPADVIVTNEQDKTQVFIECRHSPRPPSGGQFQRWIKQLRSYGLQYFGEELGRGTLLVLARLPERWDESWLAGGDDGLMVWEGPEHNDELARKVEAAFADRL